MILDLIPLKKFSHYILTLFVVSLFFPSLTLGQVAMDAQNKDLAKQYQNLLTDPLPTIQQIQMLYRDTIHHPVANLAVVSKYDPSGLIGFCFGRAMAAHLLAVRMGIKEEAIRKLFIVGDLRSDPARPEWRFHVTTLVKARDAQGQAHWFAIDPIMYNASSGNYQPPTAAQWMYAVRMGWDTWHVRINADSENFKAHFYLTPAETVMPEIAMPEADGIMSLEFTPNENNGLIPGSDWHKEFNTPEHRFYQVYVPTQAAREKLFFTTHTPIQEKQFNFVGIKIGTLEFDYRGYFADLLASLKTRPNERLAAAHLATRAHQPFASATLRDQDRLIQLEKPAGPVTSFTSSAGFNLQGLKGLK